MDQPVSVPEMTDNLMELADTFGTFATLFWREQQTREYQWQNGGFRLRQNGVSRLLHLTVQTSDSRIGQAWTEDGSLAALQRCYHHARNHARAAAPVLRAIRTLADEEQRLPALAADWHRPEWVEQMPREVEKLHRQLMSRISPCRLTTTLRLIEEQVRAVRSDGMCHSTRFTRLVTDHVFPDSAHTAAAVMRTGITLSPGVETAMEEHLAALAAEMDHCLGQRTDTPRSHPAACSFAPRLDRIPLWIDLHLLARMLVAWIKSGHQPAASRATIQLIALDGSPGYSPIHPWGYLFPPLTLSSPSGEIPSDRFTICNVPSFFNHLMIELPLWGKETAGPCELFDLGDGSALLVEGADWFSFDAHSGLCCFLPRRIRTRDGELAPALIELPLRNITASLWAGTGGSATVWGGDLWTATGPRYVYMQPAGGDPHGLD